MHTTTAFAAWPNKPVRGLDFLFTLGRPKSPLGCLPLSLYTFSATWIACKAWLGITMREASPSLTGDRARVSSCAAQCRIERYSFPTRSDPAESSPTSCQTAPPRNKVAKCTGGERLFQGQIQIIQHRAGYKTARNTQYTSTFTAVSGIPMRANSRKPMVCPVFFSAFWMMMTLLAAPRMSRFLATVLP
jgi:hypothetical protein